MQDGSFAVEILYEKGDFMTEEKFQEGLVRAIRYSNYEEKRNIIKIIEKHLYYLQSNTNIH